MKHVVSALVLKTASGAEGAKVLASSGLAVRQRWGAAMAEGLVKIPAEGWFLMGLDTESVL